MDINGWGIVHGQCNKPRVKWVDIPCETCWSKAQGMGMIGWWRKVGLLWSIGAILTSKFGCDAHHHFEDGGNVKFVIPNGSQTIPPSWNPKPSSHLAITLNFEPCAQQKKVQGLVSYTNYKIQTLSLTHEHLEGARFGHVPTIKTTI
jgi:hypothetical protein